MSFGSSRRHCGPTPRWTPTRGAARAASASRTQGPDESSCGRGDVEARFRAATRWRERGWHAGGVAGSRCDACGR
eukprot:scaffold23186_cov112-Isochrysis_galbana.AAC.4